MNGRGSVLVNALLHGLVHGVVDKTLDLSTTSPPVTVNFLTTCGLSVQHGSAAEMA